MSHHNLHAAIARAVSLDDGARAGIDAAFAAVTCTRGHCLSAVGAPARYAYFLTAGALRAFFVDADGTERTIELSFEGDWAGDIGAFLTGAPVTVRLEALEDVRALRVGYDELERLLSEVPALEKYFRVLYAHAYASYTARLRQFITWTAAERYAHLVEHRASVLHRVPLRVVASYIGVTPESLSRIRREYGGGAHG